MQCVGQTNAARSVLASAGIGRLVQEVVPACRASGKAVCGHSWTHAWAFCTGVLAPRSSRHRSSAHPETAAQWPPHMPTSVG